MATDPTKLPARFRPFLDQAQTEASLRYGGQEAMFGTVLSQLVKDRDRQLGAQQTAHQSVLGMLQGADANVNRYYNDAGLTPTVLGSLAQDATGRRLASEMAGYRAQNQNGLLGQLQGNQYQQARINQDYGDKSQTVLDQASAEQRERGLFTSSLLDQLISGDRTARRTANAQARQLAHDDLQAQLDRATSQGNALIGQGLVAGEDGELQPLPGGKADPNAPGNQPKPKPAPKPTGADRTIQASARKATSWIKQIDAANQKSFPDPAKRRAVVQEILLKGDQEAGIPSISDAGLDVALDVYYNKALSPATVQALHNAGVKIKFLNGVETQRQREQRRNRPNRPTSNLGASGPGSKQQRPT